MGRFVSETILEATDSDPRLQSKPLNHGPEWQLDISYQDHDKSPQNSARRPKLWLLPAYTLASPFEILLLMEAVESGGLGRVQVWISQIAIRGSIRKRENAPR